MVTLSLYLKMKEDYKICSAKHEEAWVSLREAKIKLVGSICGATVGDLIVKDGTTKVYKVFNFGLQYWDPQDGGSPVAIGLLRKKDGSFSHIPHKIRDWQPYAKEA